MFGAARPLAWDETNATPKRKPAPAFAADAGLAPLANWSGDLGRLRLFGLAQHIAAPPDGLDIIVSAAGEAELLAKLADEDVDDLQFRLVHAAVKMVQEHFLGERGALAQREQLQHRIFLAGQMDAAAVDLDRLRVEIDRELAGLDDRLAVALRAADDRMDAGDQLLAVERLGNVIVGAEA